MALDQRLARVGLADIGAEILAELGMEMLFRHGHPGEPAHRVERALDEVLDLEDFGEIAQHLDDAELLPGLQLEIHDRERALLGLLRQHAIPGDSHLAAELEEAVMVAVLLHHDPAGQPFGVGRGRQRDRRLVIDTRSIELVDRVADHDLAAALPVLLGGAPIGLHAFDLGKFAHAAIQPLAFSASV